MKIKKILISLVFLLCVVSLTSCKKNIKKAYKDFSSVSSEFCKIPGLKTKFVPQGIAYNELHNLILVVGYNSDDTASPIYVLDSEGNEIKRVTFKTESGKEYTGHAGGVVTINDLVLVSSGKKVYTLDINKILAAEENECITVEAITKVDVDGATMFIYENLLFVTEFYYPKKYETEESHYVATSSGTNKALAFGYEINEDSISGIASNKPVVALSIPDKVQGIVVKDDVIYFSTSYGRNNDSYLYKYENVFFNECKNKYKYSDDVELDLYVIDPQNQISSLYSPSMSEGICFFNDKLLILFESGAKKYRATTKCEVYYIWESSY